MPIPRILLIRCALTLASGLPASAQVVINELHYHPVEEPAFTSTGAPVLDLTDDVHEFVEIRNVGASAVDLSGWTLDDGVNFTLPPGTTIAAGGYRVIAKNPARIQSVYGITGVLGPYAGVLKNGGDTVKLKNSSGAVVDSVSYSDQSPWPISADALGAGSSFYGFSFYPYQYKGRSLERVSTSSSSNDPANWLASPLASGPSPGAGNAVTLTTPKPVIVASRVSQSSDESPVIRGGQSVNVEATFSSSAILSSVDLEWFLDDAETTNELRSIVSMTSLGNHRWTTGTPLPGQVNRSIVRWRIIANRGAGPEIVYPRADDPQFAPIGASGAREAWNAWFVQPDRSSTKPIYDFFISAANVATLDTNIAQNPRRVTNPNPPGYPRDDAKKGYFPPNPNYNPVNYPAVAQPNWDGTVPAVFVRSGVVHDIVARYHGSRYQRSPGKNSWKFTFPAFRLVDGKQRILVTEKTSATVLGLALFREANLPANSSQFVDFYKNAENVIQRCEISDADEETIARYQREQKAANPQNPPVFSGDGIIYKSKGLDGNEGPYGWANGQPMPGVSVWSALDRYIHSYPSQFNDWRGHLELKAMIDSVWSARGDAPQLSYPATYAGTNHGSQTAVGANIANLRTHLSANWDVDKMLTFLAVRNWCSPWDDKFHNHYVYRQPNGLWIMTPWDFDGEMSGGATGDAGYANSIFAGRKDDSTGAYSNNSRGPNWFKDHFLRAYDAEFKQRLFILNNTLLSPQNVAATAAAYSTPVPDTAWLNNRFASINAQCGLGPWLAPAQPANLGPAAGTGVVPPGNFVSSPYAHTSGDIAGGHSHAKTRWEVRHSSGTYRAPVYKVETTTALTSLPIPFAELEFGQSYSWRVTYIDADNHPSAPSAETSFGFGPQPSSVTLISLGDTWKYNHADSFANNSWAQPGFNDSGWSSGPGALAFESNGTLEPIRTTPPGPTTLAPAGRTYYFRKDFDFPGNPATSTVRIRHLIDDGCVIWINGQKVHRYFMDERANYATAEFTSGGPGEAVFQFADNVANTANWTWIDPRPFLVQGRNVIAVEVHQTGATSSDVVFALEFTGTVITNGGDVALNEIMADNSKAVANGTSHPDYVEIRNNTTAPVSLSGWSLSDDVLNPVRFSFPAGTTIPASGRLVVWCDSNVADPGLHAGFALSQHGQTVALFQGTNVRDFVTFGPQARDLPLGRVNDGIGSWTLVQPSPGAANAAVTLGSPAGLKVNEWMANPRNGEDWFELHNPGVNPVALGLLWLSDTAGSAITRIPEHSYIGGGGYTRFEADGINSGDNHSNFKLGTSGDSLFILAANGSSVIDSVSFGAQALGVSQGRIPDAAAVIANFPSTSSPGASNWLEAPIVINEALTNSAAPKIDAIELVNLGGGSVDIGGWWLSDDPAAPRKFQIPSGTSINAGGVRVFQEAAFNSGPAAFALSSLGDEIILSAIDGIGALTGFRSQVKFGGADENGTLGRVATSIGSDFFPQSAETVGGANAGPRIGPVIINEISYHPPDLAGADNVRDEFIELHNLTTGLIDLSGWELKDAADFTFMPGSSIRPGDYLIVVGFDPANATLADGFRTAHSLAPGVPLFGPYVPKLSNFSSRIELARPGTPVAGEIPRVLVDRVEYTDYAPWPAVADGTGPTLQRINRTSFGNDPVNWSAGGPTPAALNTGQAAIVDSDGDGIPDTWEIANGMDRFNANDVAADIDADGQTNGAEFAAGTNPGDPQSRLAAGIARAGGGFEITVAAKAGKTYTVQYRNSFTVGVWQKLADILAQPIDVMQTIPDPAPGSQRFYRVITPKTP